MPERKLDPGPLTPRRMIAFLESLPEGWKDLPIMDDSRVRHGLFPFTGLALHPGPRLALTSGVHPCISLQGEIDPCIDVYYLPPMKLNPKAT